MSFRARIILAAALAVAAAVALASGIAYAVVKSELRSQVDDSLTTRADVLTRLPDGPGRFFPRIPDPEFGAAGGYIQLVSADGQSFRGEEESVAIPISDRTKEVAAGAPSYFQDEDVAGTHLRVLTVPFAEGVALQIARPLTEVDETLDQTRTILFLVSLSGILMAVVLGFAVARAAVAPLRRLTVTTEDVTRTRDLTQRIDVRGRDELNRLAASFNTMLAALEESARSQRQFVADASHELRTPLTSLRTNIEVLARDESMAPEERERLLGDVVDQFEEMSVLITELVELARGEQEAPEGEDVRLDLVAAEAVERARRNRPGGHVRAGRRGDARPRRPRPDRARHLEPARQRGQVEPRRRAGPGRGARRAGHGARPRARHRGRGPPARLRQLLPRARRPAGCPARGSASRSSGASPSRTAAASPRSPRTAVARSSGSAS